MSGTATRFLVQPSTRIHGETAIPGDKSISHRALMLGSLAEGDTEIHGFLESEDCLATLMALRQLGVRIEGPNDGHVIVHGHGSGALRAPAGPLDMGNAGTAMRLFMGLLASQPFDSQLIGDASLSRRPMERVAVPLRLMGAHIMTRDGRPPVDIHGGHPLCAIDYELPVPSAQVKSAILLAALRADGRTRVIEPAPSRDHTERMLASFGVEVLHSGGTIALQGGQLLRSTRLQVPGDFSSAAFFIVAGCLAAPQGLMLRGIGLNPTRTGLLNLLREMGADIRVRPLGSVQVPRRIPPPSRSRTSRSTQALCTASKSPRPTCRLRSMSCRCSSLPPPAHQARPWCAVRLSCASRRATVWPPWQRAWGVSASSMSF